MIPAMVRRVACVPLGVVAGLLASLAIMEGIWRAHGPEIVAAPEQWDFFVWGNHYLWRVIASGVAAAAGGYVAGSVARSAGAVVGVLSAVPSMLVWLWVVIAATTGRLLFLTDGPPQDGAYQPAWGDAAMALACAAVGGAAGGAGGHAAVENVGSDEDVGRLGWHLVYMLPIAVVGLALSAFWVVPLPYNVRYLMNLGPSDPLFNFSSFLSSWGSIVVLVVCMGCAILPWVGLNAAREVVLGSASPRRAWKAVGCAVGGLLATIVLTEVVPRILLWLRT